MMLIILGIIVFLMVITIIKKKKYLNSSYYHITGIPYAGRTRGEDGEYAIYRKLQHLEATGGKFLFNVYLPTARSGTTEIDVLFISSAGLFVFESKNYGGWIFGDEHSQNWLQTFPMGRGQSRREFFYNPILQNGTHLKYLKRLVGHSVPMHSIIVFSNRCTLKKVKVESRNVYVINLSRVTSLVAEIDQNTASHMVSQDEVELLYNKLYPYSQVNDVVRYQHNQNVGRLNDDP